MENAGVNTLFASSITSALSSEAYTAITSLDGMSSVCLVAELLGASGGTSIDIWVQTTFDDGTTWLDVALFQFTTTAGKKYLVLNANASRGVTSYAALSSEGVNDGLLGNQLRAVVTSTGTYADTTASVRAHVH